MDTDSLFIFFSGATKVASITPLGEWLHDYKAGETNSRMQLRQGAVLSQFTQQYPGGKAKDGWDLWVNYFSNVGTMVFKWWDLEAGVFCPNLDLHRP